MKPSLKGPTDAHFLWEESFISMAWNDTKRCGHLCPRNAELLLALQRCLCSCTLFSLINTRFSRCYRVHVQSLWRAEHIVLNIISHPFWARFSWLKRLYSSLFLWKLGQNQTREDPYVCAHIWLWEHLEMGLRGACVSSPLWVVAGSVQEPEIKV